MRRATLAVVVALLVVAAGVGVALLARGGRPVTPPTAGSKYAAQIKALESAVPAADLTAAWAASDRRFVGVMGVGLVVPGVTNYYAVYDKSNGVRIIPNTSDAIESDEHARLRDVAHEYALRYNRLLLAKLATTQPATSKGVSVEDARRQAKELGR